MSAEDLQDVPHELDGLDSLPRSIEAEQAVLGALWLDNEAWDRVADLLTAADFFDFRHRLIFETVGSQINACKPADVLTTWDALKAAGNHDKVGGIEYLQAVHHSAYTAAHARRHAEIVRRYARQRALIAAADEAGTLARKEADVNEVADRLATRFADLQQGMVRKMPRHTSELVCERVDHWDALSRGERPIAWPTGIDSIDDALNGGLRGGKVYVLAARPSVGKSSLAQAILLALAHAGLTGLMLSQEMEASECMDRAVAHEGLIDYRHLQTGRFADDEWGRLTEATDVVQRLPLHIDDEGGLTLAAIRGKCVALRRHGLKVAVLDYLQLCDYQAAKGQTTNDALGNLSKGLKRLAKDLGIALIVLSQLNREVERRASPKPNLADLRDSGAIEQDADVVLMLYPVRDLGETQIVGLSIPKNRQGAFKGELALEFRGRYQRWRASDADLTVRKPAEAGRGFE